MNISFKTNVLVKKPLDKEYSNFEYILPFVLPQGLQLDPYVSDGGKSIYALNYKLKHLTANPQNITRNTPITSGGNVILDVDPNLKLEKYLFIMYDSHCNGTNTEYLITFEKT
jgi:hypothetical protein